MSLYLIARIGMLGVVCIGMALAASAGEIPEMGQKAPHVDLPSQDGSKVNLSSFHGKWVVL